MLNRTTPPEKADEFWKNFKTYLLQNQNEKTAYDTFSYARRYAHVLAETNAQELLQLSDDKRKHAMKALAALSKFMGCYDMWEMLKERHQLKWSNSDGLEAFHAIINNDANYKVMMEWLKDACSKIPASYANMLLYDTLTGLRPGEAIMSIYYVQNELDNYLKKESMVLEHYRFKSDFIRRTKKAYISTVDDSIINVARKAGIHSYTALRMVLEERGLAMHMGYCRKIFSTHLRMSGIESELIDLLQGRTPSTIFARHYFRPDFPDEIKRIRSILSRLQETILGY
ncbi:integrase [Nitrososphaera sp.]|uniref:integrase n=1 Tax=Nitrososphaera sp. TaxID=1971748 RepID=UPI00183F7753|nr:integrase [Nitrososphaera sp.]NWG36016.1 hypothetical protein [Nitrososphaera sp.]